MKVVTVSDLIKILDTKENRYGATGKPRILNLSLNGNFAGDIESVKLDGYGDGLITDVTMEITTSKSTTTVTQKQIVSGGSYGTLKRFHSKLQTDYLLKAMRFWMNVVLSATNLTIRNCLRCNYDGE